jgi:hypothetical protein
LRRFGEIECDRRRFIGQRRFFGWLPRRRGCIRIGRRIVIGTCSGLVLLIGAGRASKNADSRADGLSSAVAWQTVSTAVQLADNGDRPIAIPCALSEPGGTPKRLSHEQ